MEKLIKIISSPFNPNMEVAGDLSIHLHVPYSENEVTVKIADGSVWFNDVTPSPVSNKAIVNYSLTSDGNVTIEFFDINGKVAKSFNVGSRTAGNYDEEFNVSELSSGTYTVVIRSNDIMMSKTIQVVK